MALSAATALADCINGGLGVTGYTGLPITADKGAGFVHNRADVGLVGDVSLIYGIGDHFAAQFEVSPTAFGSPAGGFGVTDVSRGGLCRFSLRNRQPVPFPGGSMDLLVSNYDPNDGPTRHEGYDARGAPECRLGLLFCQKARASPPRPSESPLPIRG